MIIKMEVNTRPVDADEIVKEYAGVIYEGPIDVLMATAQTIELEKTYSKNDYIMALHKEYGCTIAEAKKAHDLALEYLQSIAKMRG